jgi:hypothetical protein
LQKQENVFLIRQNKRLPNPIMVSSSVHHWQQRHLKTLKQSYAVETNHNHWLNRTLVKKTVQQILPTTTQTFVSQKNQTNMNAFLQVCKSENYVSKKHYSTKKTQLLQTFASHTSQKQTSVKKVVQLYAAPVHYHFVQNFSRLERLLQTGADSGRLIFTGTSSLTLTGDSAVTVA